MWQAVIVEGLGRKDQISLDNGTFYVCIDNPEAYRSSRRMGEVVRSHMTTLVAAFVYILMMTTLTSYFVFI